MINFIIGYLIVINILSMILIYIDYTFNLKIKEDVLDFIYIIIALFGGSIGIIITSKMFMYKRDDKTIKRIVPLILFIEIVIVLIIFSKVELINSGLMENSKKLFNFVPEIWAANCRIDSFISSSHDKERIPCHSVNGSRKVGSVSL